jgi:hypothetical protein
MVDLVPKRHASQLKDRSLANLALARLIRTWVRTLQTTRHFDAVQVDLQRLF